MVPTIKEEFGSVIRHFRPPRYPYEIDQALAARGRELFNSGALGCAGCHGVYDGHDNVDWPGRHGNVGTDRSRILLDTARHIARQLPAAEIGTCVLTRRGELFAGDANYFTCALASKPGSRGRRNTSSLV